jgi:alpha-N-arabinofuranosidase
MYRSLWAEMLHDRTFYFPIVAKDPEPKAPENPMARMMRLRKWRPVGGDDVVAMDKESPFVGDQSPRIAPDTSSPQGIREACLPLPGDGVAVASANAASLRPSRALPHAPR